MHCLKFKRSLAQVYLTGAVVRIRAEQVLFGNSYNIKYFLYLCTQELKTKIMKRLLPITIMLLMAIVMSAQDYKVIECNFNTCGMAAALCEKPNPNDCMNNMMLKDGYSWHLKNTILDGDNFIEFWLTRDSDGTNFNYASWDQDVMLVLFKDDNDITSYFVMDKDFLHLTITIDKDGKAGIHLCSILRE